MADENPADDSGVSAVKLDGGGWVWVCQLENGSFFQGAKHYRRRADAVKAGLVFESGV